MSIIKRRKCIWYKSYRRKKWELHIVFLRHKLAPCHMYCSIYNDEDCLVVIYSRFLTLQKRNSISCSTTILQDKEWHNTQPHTLTFMNVKTSTSMISLKVCIACLKNILQAYHLAICMNVKSNSMKNICHGHFPSLEIRVTKGNR